MKALRDQEEYNSRLMAYVDSLLTTIIEKHPELLEVKRWCPPLVAMETRSPFKHYALHVIGWEEEQKEIKTHAYMYSKEINVQCLHFHLLCTFLKYLIFYLYAYLETACFFPSIHTTLFPCKLLSNVMITILWIVTIISTWRATRLSASWILTWTC